jgi:hypothetical protein
MEVVSSGRRCAKVWMESWRGKEESSSMWICNGDWPALVPSEIEVECMLAVEMTKVNRLL